MATDNQEPVTQPTTEERDAKRKRYLRYAGIALVVFLILTAVAVLIWEGFTQDWKFFTEARTTRIETSGTETTEVYHRTLWDWMGLLIIPLALGVGVFLLNRSEQRRQAEIAARRAETDRLLADKRAETEQALALNRIREDRLQAYLDRMTDLLLEKGLRDSPEDSEIRHVARTRTLTVLRGLDSELNGFLLSFLRDSELIAGQDPVIPLSASRLNRADLSEVDLREVELSRVNLMEADLLHADLSGANLSEADLSWAKMLGANLSKANLSEADLSWAKMRGANLSRANLSGADMSTSDLLHADLRGANLRGANLTTAKLSIPDDFVAALQLKADWSKAKLIGAKYDDATKWPSVFDPAAAGAIKVDRQPSDETSTDERGQA